MKKQTRTLTIEIPEASYWLLLAIAALETLTAEEFVKDLIEHKIENAIADSGYIREKAYEISALLN